MSVRRLLFELKLYIYFIEMHFDTLNTVPISTVAAAFNKAFEDYAINMHRTDEQMAEKIHAESIDLSVSVGAFEGDDLVGFILFGLDTVRGALTMWDGGTGVVAEYRGQRLTQKMFEYMLPHIKEAGVKRILLEVLESNHSAYRIYENLGFRKTRVLHAYEGSVTTPQIPQHNISILDSFDIDALLSLGNWQPAWQQMNNRVKGWGNAITTIGIKQDDEVVAYAHYNPTTKRVFQFGVQEQHRRKGMGTALFNYICNHASPISIVNVDEQSTDAIAFLEAIGIAHYINQYEMEMML